MATNAQFWLGLILIIIGIIIMIIGGYYIQANKNTPDKITWWMNLMFYGGLILIFLGLVIAFFPTTKQPEQEVTGNMPIGRGDIGGFPYTPVSNQQLYTSQL